MVREAFPFDIAEYLETIEVAQTRIARDLTHALNIAARAKGMTEIAKQVSVTRASLYKSLAEDGNPRFETISKTVDAFGCK